MENEMEEAVNWLQARSHGSDPSAEFEVFGRSDEAATACYIQRRRTVRTKAAQYPLGKYRCCSQATDKSLAFWPSAVGKDLDDDCAALRMPSSRRDDSGSPLGHTSTDRAHALSRDEHTGVAFLL